MIRANVLKTVLNFIFQNLNIWRKSRDTPTTAQLAQSNSSLLFECRVEYQPRNFCCRDILK